MTHDRVRRSRGGATQASFVLFAAAWLGACASPPEARQIVDVDLATLPPEEQRPAETPEPAPTATTTAVAAEPTPTAPLQVPAPPAPTVAASGSTPAAAGEIALPSQVLFGTGNDQLRPESDAVLQVALDFMNATPSATLLRIEVHTDSDGAEKANQTLSESRANSVARWFVAHGMDCKRLLPVGFGETKPIAPNDSPANKAKNRRVQLFIAALRGRPVGGMPVDGGGKVSGDPCI